MGQAEQPIDPRPRQPDALTEAETVEDGEAERLEEQPRADRMWRLEPFEQLDPMAGAREEEGRGHSGDPAADDGNAVRAATRGSSA